MSKEERKATNSECLNSIKPGITSFITPTVSHFVPHSIPLSSSHQNLIKVDVHRKPALCLGMYESNIHPFYCNTTLGCDLQSLPFYLCLLVFMDTHVSWSIRGSQKVNSGSWLCPLTLCRVWELNWGCQAWQHTSSHTKPPYWLLFYFLLNKDLWPF